MLNGVSGMIGETAVVRKPVSDSHEPGSVFSRGEEWYAVSLFPGTTIDVGTTVVVADVERGLLVVYPRSGPDPVRIRSWPALRCVPHPCVPTVDLRRWSP
jgi:membrane-bound ClpP family serine protease